MPAMLSLTQLIACGVAPTPARTVLPILQVILAKAEINTPQRAAGFIGQCMVESNGLREFEENLWWETPKRVLQFFPSRVSSIAQATQLCRNPQALANCVYAGKNGNGPASSGDGWRYRGRGGLGTTGADNYRAAGAGTGRPYLEQPELLALPPDAILSAAWYWTSNGCNKLADAWQIDRITVAIAGAGMPQADVRRQCAVAALTALH